MARAAIIRAMTLVLAGATLSACDPQAIADDVSARAALNVAQNVVSLQYPAPQAAVAAECLIANASADEINALARDVGTRPGTLTEATVRGIGARPAAAACLTSRGLAPLNI